MTVKELFDWAVENGVENYDICASYADGGGYYPGERDVEKCDVEIDSNRKNIIL